MNPICIFKDLIELYPTWPELERYLESEEGGLFRISDRSEDGRCLIRYEKDVTNMNLPHSKWFRSVVWDMNLHRPISISPPKAVEDCPYVTDHDLESAGVVCQELLDGFMINGYKRVGDETFYISSRSKLDATGTFYSDKSFRHLFIEAYTGWIVASEDSLEWLIQEESKNIPSPHEENQEVAVGYSFVVQHKEHRIVKDFTQNATFFIHKSIVYQDGTVLIQDHMTEIDIPHHIIQQPPVLQPQGNISEWIKGELENRSWDVQGIVLRDQRGNRWRYRSEKYNAVRSLRGNTPRVMDQFVQLYLQNVVPIYLTYYPADSMTFTFYTEFIHQVVKMLYEHYVELRIRRSTTLTLIDRMYHPHLYAIHGIYQTKLRPQPVTIDTIYDYLRTLPWQRVSFLLRNYMDSYFSMINHIIQT